MLTMTFLGKLYSWENRGMIVGMALSRYHTGTWFGKLIGNLENFNKYVYILFVIERVTGGCTVYLRTEKDRRKRLRNKLSTLNEKFRALLPDTKNLNLLSNSICISNAENVF